MIHGVPSSRALGGSIALAAHDPATDEIEQTAGVVIVAMIVIYMSLGVRLQVVYTGFQKYRAGFKSVKNRQKPSGPP